MILGCAMPEAEQGLNVARIASLRAGVPVTASAVTVNRFCSSGLQSIAFAAERIMAGFATTIVAGGTESMSLVPMGGHKVAPNPALVDSYPGRLPDAPASSPRTTRARRASRARSRTRSRCAAISARSRRSTPGRFAGRDRVRWRSAGQPFETDEGPRRDTSLEALGEAAAGVSRQGHGHGRQLVADERRRRGRRRDVRRIARASSGSRRSAASSRSRPPASSRSASASVRCRRSARC